MPSLVRLALDLLSFGLLVGSTIASHFQSASAYKIIDAEVDTYVTNVLADWGTSAGISLAVVRRKEDGTWDVETKGYGNATYDGQPFTDASVFNLASNSKVFCAIAAGLLIHNTSLSPQIQWTSKMKALLGDEWELQDPFATNESTIKDLISHRTGLPRNDWGSQASGGASAIERMLASLKHYRPSAEFRDIWQYNNLMYITLSTLPTRLLPDRPSFARYVQENIFDRLGMTGATYSTKRANITGNRVEGITREHLHAPSAGEVLAPGIMRPLPIMTSETGEDGDFTDGAGGVWATMADLVLWLQTMLLQGRNPQTNEQEIPREVLQMVTSPITISPFLSASLEASPGLYGGGQYSTVYRGHRLIEHGGDNLGFHSQVSYLPDDMLGIAVVSNDDAVGSQLQSIVKWHIIDKILGLQAIDWNERLKSAYLAAFPGPQPTRRQSPTHPTVVDSFHQLAGRYYDPGYGPVELCFIEPTQSLGGEKIDQQPMIFTPPSHTSMSASCQEVLSDIHIRLPGVIDRSIPSYIISWDYLFPYALFQHFDGNIFNVTQFASMSTKASPDDNHPFFVYPTTRTRVYPFTAEFGSDSSSEENDGTSSIGFGLFGNFWGGAAGSKRYEEHTAKEDAEVWFKKVD